MDGWMKGMKDERDGMGWAGEEIDHKNVQKEKRKQKEKHLSSMFCLCSSDNT